MPGFVHGYMVACICISERNQGQIVLLSSAGENQTNGCAGPCCIHITSICRFDCIHSAFTTHPSRIAIASPSLSRSMRAALCTCRCASRICCFLLAERTCLFAEPSYWVSSTCGESINEKRNSHPLRMHLRMHVHCNRLAFSMYSSLLLLSLLLITKTRLLRLRNTD